MHREFFRDKPAEFDFRLPGKIFIEQYAKFIACRNKLLGSENQLADLRKSLGKRGRGIVLSVPAPRELAPTACA